MTKIPKVLNTYIEEKCSITPKEAEEVIKNSITTVWRFIKMLVEIGCI